MKKLVLAAALALSAVPMQVWADNFIGDTNQVNVIFGGTSEGRVTGKFGMEQGRTRIFGGEGFSDLSVGYSDIEYLSLNVRLVLFESVEYAENENGQFRNSTMRVFLVFPFLGDVRIKPGYNDAHADEWGDNLSMDASYGGIGFELARDISNYVRIAGRASFAHRATSEMLPEGRYTTLGAELMDRRDEDGFLVTNVIDASGSKLEVKIQAEVLRKLLVSLRAAASKLAQNGTEYFDREAQLHMKYRVANRGRTLVNLYGDYYVRETDLTDLGDERKFQLVTGGLSLDW